MRMKSLNLKISNLIVPEQRVFYFQDSYLSKCAKRVGLNHLKNCMLDLSTKHFINRLISRVELAQ